MPEYCVECWNKMNKSNLTENDIILSIEKERCDLCNEKKNVIIKFKNWNFLKRQSQFVEIVK